MRREPSVPAGQVRSVKKCARTAVLATTTAAAVAALVAILSPAARAQQSTGLPQAFLLGSWTGGLFPPPGALNAEQCLMQPTVIFTRDLVLRATLTDQFYIQRLVETARGTGNGLEFRFSAAISGSAAGLSGLTETAATGFGCEDPDVLHVQRIGPNEVRFPGCRDFPFSLVRCPGT
jgi:hypothetical protein